MLDPAELLPGEEHSPHDAAHLTDQGDARSPAASLLRQLTIVPSQIRRRVRNVMNRLRENRPGEFSGLPIDMSTPALASAFLHPGN